MNQTKTIFGSLIKIDLLTNTATIKEEYTNKMENIFFDEITISPLRDSFGKWLVINIDSQNKVLNSIPLKINYDIF